MAANTGKDQPPAYTSQASTAGNNPEASTTPTLKPNHSTRASELLRASFEGSCTTSQYLELTFSVMVHCGTTSEPVVLAIDEDYETLFDDFQRIFVEPPVTENANKQKKPTGRRMTQMKVAWGRAEKEFVIDPGWGSTMKTGNITAMLRLLKSRNGKDYIRIG